MTRATEFPARLRAWLRALFTRQHVERDLSREMAFHIDMEREKLIREGVAAGDADRRARVAFGGVQRFTEDVRDERGTLWLDNLRQDVRFALRQFAHAPFITATMVAMLAIGIGANSVLFTFIEAMMLRTPAGILANNALVRVRGTRGMGGTFAPGNLPYTSLTELRGHSEIFSGVTGWTGSSTLIKAPGSADPDAGNVQFVTSGYFAILGVRPALGRVLPSEDDNAPASDIGAVVSYGFWRGPLGGAPDAIGKSMNVGNAIVTIVGVAPPAFNGAEQLNSPAARVWLPISARAAVTGEAGGLSGDSTPPFYGVGVLRDGVGIDQANALVRVIGSRSVDRRGTALTADVVRLRADNRDINGRSETPVLIAILGAISLLILAIICSNVSALLMGRAMTRRREIGVRLSLGASRGRLVRQLVTESALLSFLGGALGLVVLGLLMAVIRRWAPDAAAFTPGWWTIAGTSAFAIATGIAFGLSPALHATRTSVFDALKESSAAGTSQTRGQRRLVVAQIALSQPLLVGLGMLVATVVQSERARLKSDVSERIAILEVNTRSGRTDADVARVHALSARVAGLFAGVPGVERVAIGTGWESSTDFQVRPKDSTEATGETFRSSIHALGPGYFRLLNVRLASGREFDSTDIAGAPTTLVIGSDLAKHLFGAANPVGRTITCVRYCKSPNYTVVGVVDADDAGPSVKDGRLFMYYPASQDKYFTDPTFYVRVRGNASVILPRLREVIRQEYPGTAFGRVSTLAAENARHKRENMLSSAAATAGGLLALLLAAIGLYAVVSYAVGQRTREIGVRIALGAREGQVVRHFFRDGVKLSLIGSVIGLPASAFAVRGFMSGIHYQGAGAWQVATVIACLVTGVAMIATWIPARRAARIDPMRALRAD